MSLKTVAVVGATGLIGRHLVKQLQANDQVETIRVLVRRPVTFTEPKVEVKLVDFSDAESFKLAIDGAQAVFCAVGTTQKKVKGNKEAYRKVDFDIPVNAARFCSETGCRQFLLVSSVGANSRSKNFYLQLKGDVEDALRQQQIRHIAVFRPSVLLGSRNETRPGEKIGQVVMQAFSFLLIGRLRKYHPVHAKDVAAAMVAVAEKSKSVFTIYQYPFPK